MRIVAKRNSTTKYVWPKGPALCFLLNWDGDTFPENVLTRILAMPNPLAALDEWVQDGCSHPAWWRAQVHGWMDSVRALGFTEFTLERD